MQDQADYIENKQQSQKIEETKNTQEIILTMDSLNQKTQKIVDSRDQDQIGSKADNSENVNDLKISQLFLASSLTPESGMLPPSSFNPVQIQPVPYFAQGDRISVSSQPKNISKKENTSQQPISTVIIRLDSQIQIKNQQQKNGQISPKSNMPVQNLNFDQSIAKDGPVIRKKSDFRGAFKNQKQRHKAKITNQDELAIEYGLKIKRIKDNNVGTDPLSQDTLSDPEYSSSPISRQQIMFTNFQKESPQVGTEYQYKEQDKNSNKPQTVGSLRRNFSPQSFQNRNSTLKTSEDMMMVQTPLAIIGKPISQGSLRKEKSKKETISPLQFADPILESNQAEELISNREIQDDNYNVFSFIENEIKDSNLQDQNVNQESSVLDLDENKNQILNSLLKDEKIGHGINSKEYKLENTQYFNIQELQNNSSFVKDKLFKSEYIIKEHQKVQSEEQSPYELSEQQSLLKAKMQAYNKPKINKKTYQYKYSKDQLNSVETSMQMIQPLKPVSDEHQIISLTDSKDPVINNQEQQNDFSLNNSLIISQYNQSGHSFFSQNQSKFGDQKKHDKSLVGTLKGMDLIAQLHRRRPQQFVNSSLPANFELLGKKTGIPDIRQIMSPKDQNNRMKTPRDGDQVVSEIPEFQVGQSQTDFTKKSLKQRKSTQMIAGGFTGNQSFFKPNSIGKNKKGELDSEDSDFNERKELIMGSISSNANTIYNTERFQKQNRSLNQEYKRRQVIFGAKIKQNLNLIKSDKFKFDADESNMLNSPRQQIINVTKQMKTDFLIPQTSKTGGSQTIGSERASLSALKHLFIQQVKNDVAVTLSPSLKHYELACLDVSPADFKLDYDKIFPKTTINTDKNPSLERQMNDPTRRATNKYKEFYQPTERIIQNSFIQVPTRRDKKNLARSVFVQPEGGGSVFNEIEKRLKKETRKVERINPKLQFTIPEYFYQHLLKNKKGFQDNYLATQGQADTQRQAFTKNYEKILTSRGESNRNKNDSKQNLKNMNLTFQAKGDNFVKDILSDNESQDEKITLDQEIVQGKKNIDLRIPDFQNLKNNVQINQNNSVLQNAIISEYSNQFQENYEIQSSPFEKLNNYLNPDEEFVIQNYRLIKTKKVQTNQRKSVENQKSKSSSNQNSPQLKCKGSPKRLSPEQGFRPIFQSQIRVSNSIISPHTFKFSTYIGSTDEMKWDDVARLNLSDLNQARFIKTLDGKIKLQNAENQDQIDIDQYLISLGIDLKSVGNLTKEEAIGDYLQIISQSERDNLKFNEEQQLKSGDGIKPKLEQIQQMNVPKSRRSEKCTTRQSIPNSSRRKQSQTTKIEASVVTPASNQVTGRNLISSQLQSQQASQNLQNQAFLPSNLFEQKCIQAWLVNDQQKLPSPAKLTSNIKLEVPPLNLLKKKVSKIVEENKKINQTSFDEIVPTFVPNEITKTGLSTTFEHPGEILSESDSPTRTRSAEDFAKVPYQFLQAKYVLKQQCIELNQQFKLSEQIVDSSERIKVFLNLNKSLLGYLDKRKALAEVMTFDFFVDDFMTEAKEILEDIEQRRRLQMPPIKAQSYFYHIDGKVETIFVDVVGFDSKLKKFIVEFVMPGESLSTIGRKVVKIQKTTGRLNLVFEGRDTESQLQKRFQDAQLRRKSALQFLAEERIINNELVYAYQDIFMPNSLKKSISKRVQASKIKFDQYQNPNLIKQLILQVESHYTYQTLRSVIYSQQNDPIIHQLMLKYELKPPFNIEVDKEISICQVFKIPVFSQERNSHMKNSIEQIKINSIAGQSKFMAIIAYLKQLTCEVINGIPLFEEFNNLQKTTLQYLINNDKKFSDYNEESLRKSLKSFPIELSVLMEIQNQISDRFQKAIKKDWHAPLINKLETLGDVLIGRKRILVQSLEQIDPMFQKLMTLINIFMERQIFEKMKESMTNYIIFILKFMARLGKDITECHEFKQLGLDLLDYKIYNAPLTKITLQLGMKKNEKLSVKEISIQELGKGVTQLVFDKMQSKQGKQIFTKKYIYQLITQPDINQTWYSIRNVINQFAEAFSGMRRVEGMIFPLLKISRDQFEKPDVEQIGDFVQINQQLQWLIEKAKKSPDQIFKKVETYFEYFAISWEGLLNQMKLMQYENQFDIQTKTNKDPKHKQKIPVQKKSTKRVTEKSSLLKGSGAYLQVDEASMKAEEEILSQCKDMQISESVYKKKYNEIDDAYWEVLKSIDNEIDFGIIVLDLSTFKRKLVAKLQELRDKLQEEIRNRFLEKQRGLFKQFEDLQERVGQQFDDIDKIIAQIELVAFLFMDSGMIDSLAESFKQVIRQKNFIDNLQIKISEQDMINYCKMFAYPTQLKKLVEVQLANTDQQKNRINQMLLSDVEQIKDEIQSIKKVLVEYRTCGLQTLDELEELALKDSNNKELAKAIKDMRRTKEPYLNKEYIMNNFENLKSAEERITDLYQNIEMLQKRQEQLGIVQITFPEADSLMIELTPFKQLWEILFEYSDLKGNWWNTKLPTLNYQSVLDKCNQWGRTLAILGNSKYIKKGEPGAIRILLVNELEQIKEYLPIVQCLTTQGLEKRHFQQISETLKMNIDPAVMSVRTLQKNGLTQEKALDAVRGVSEVAYKENSIKLMVDTVENEVREIQFFTKTQASTGIRIVKDPEIVVQKFDEVMNKIQQIKGNQFAFAHKVRIELIESECANLQCGFELWCQVQKSWCYLMPIYSQAEVSGGLQRQKDVFENLAYDMRELMIRRTQREGSTCVNEFCKENDFVSTLEDMLVQIEFLDKSLNAYLDQKRTDFTRLFFTSNEELLGLMSKLNDVEYLQAFLGKLFEGIAGLRTFYKNDNLHANGFYSLQGEEIQFVDEIDMSQNPEVWLKQLEYQAYFTIYISIQKSISHLISIKDKIIDPNETIYNKRSFLSDWISKWPGQVILIAQQSFFTKQVEGIFIRDQLIIQELEQLKQELTKEIDLLTDLITLNGLPYDNEQNTQPKILVDNSLCSLRNLIIYKLQSRDLIKNMIHNQNTGDSFFWQIQLKYHYQLTLMPRLKFTNQEINKEVDKSTSSRVTSTQIHMRDDIKRMKNLGIPEEWQPQNSYNHQWLFDNLKPDENALMGVQELSISCGIARFPYGYEYCGNMPRLVITPITERALRTIFLGLHMSYAISLQGGVSTGKTETAKEFARLAGKMCFVFHCSNSITTETLIKFFKGIIAGGSWTCLDEFNRVSSNVISVISQVILNISSGIRANKQEISIDGTKPLPLNRNCGIVLTMNLQQKLHRSTRAFQSLGSKVELIDQVPISLQGQVRSIVLIQPDTKLIIQAMLLAQGFKNYEELGQKIFVVFQVAKEQFGNEISYDFSLRSIKSVISQAGQLIDEIRNCWVNFKNGNDNFDIGMQNKNQFQANADNRLKEYFQDFEKKQIKINEFYKSSKKTAPTQETQNVDGTIKEQTFKQPISKNASSPISSGTNSRDQNMRTEILKLVALKQKQDLITEQSAEENAQESIVLKTQNSKISKISKLIEPQSGRSLQKSDKQQQQDSITEDSVSSDEKEELLKQKQAKEDDQKVRVIYAQMKDELGLQSISVLQSEQQLEYFIIMKSINDQNLTKFRQPEIRQQFKSIVLDTFQQENQSDVEKKKYNKILKKTFSTTIVQRVVGASRRITLQAARLQNAMSKIVKQQGYQKNNINFLGTLNILHDLIANRKGILIVGSDATGKTTLLNLIKDSYNKMNTNEIERRKLDFLIKKQKIYESVFKEPSQGEQVSNKDSQVHENQSVPESLMKQPSIYFEEQLILPDELIMIKACVRNLSVVTHYILPFAQPIQALVGQVDPKTKEFKDGILSNILRGIHNSQEDKFSWLVFDGNFNQRWFECLNAILDEGSKLTLLSGESIPLPKSLRIVIECETLQDCSPAIISRCGVLHIDDSFVPLKQIFNKYARNFPKIISDQVQHFDNLINYFFPEILIRWFGATPSDLGLTKQDVEYNFGAEIINNSNYDQDQFQQFRKQNFLIYPMSARQAVLNFLRIFDTLIADYRDPKYSEWRIVQKILGIGKSNKHKSQNDEDQVDQSENVTSLVFSVDTHVSHQKWRVSFGKFSETESRCLNSIKLREKWVEGFFIQSLIWSFYTVLNEKTRPSYLSFLKNKIQSAKKRKSANVSILLAQFQNSHVVSSPNIQNTQRSNEDSRNPSQSNQVIYESGERPRSKNTNRQTQNDLVGTQVKTTTVNTGIYQSFQTSQRDFQQEMVFTQQKFLDLQEMDISRIPTQKFILKLKAPLQSNQSQQNFQEEDDFMKLLEEERRKQRMYLRDSRRSIIIERQLSRKASIIKQMMSPTRDLSFIESPHIEEEQDSEFISSKESSESSGDETQLSQREFEDFYLKGSMPYLDNKTLADYYFDIDSSTFELWQELESAGLIVGEAAPIVAGRSSPSNLSRQSPTFSEPFDKPSNEFKLDTFQSFVLTNQTFPIAYFTELAIFAGQSVLLVGESGSGKSWTMNHIIGDQFQRYNEQINVCPIQIYERTKALNVQKTIIDSLERIKRGVYGTTNKNKLVIHIEDLSLCQQNRVQVVADDRNAQINKDFSPQTLEIFRQIMSYKQFYDYQYSSQYDIPVLDNVEDIKLEGNISLIATMTFNSDSQFYNQNDLLPARNRSQWIMMGLSSDVNNLKDIFYSIIIRGVEGYWQSSTIQSMAGSCLKFIIELQEVYNKFMQNTINRFLLLFNSSVFYRLIHSLISLNLKMMPTFSSFDMGKFLVAESYRTLLDRFKDKADRKFLNGHIQDLAKKYFPPDAQKNEKFPAKMNRPLFSHLVGQQIIDLQFREVDKLKSLSKTIDDLMTEYNNKFKNKLTTEKSSINLKKTDEGESLDNYRPINIQLFEYVLEQVVKINRALLQPFSSTILIGIHGLGKVPLTRLSIITTKYLLFEPVQSQNFTFDSFNDLLREVIEKISTINKGCVLNLQEEELPINNHGEMLCQLSCIIRTGNIPNLFSQREEKSLLGKIESTSLPVIRRPNPSLVKKKGDTRGPPNLSMNMIIYQHQLQMRIRRQFKLLLSVQPNGPLLKNQFRKHTAFISQNTLIWLQNWPEESFKDVGQIFIQQIYELPLLWEQQQEKEETSVFSNINLEIQQDKEVVTQESKLLQTAIRMHIEAQENLVDVQRETGQYVSVSPQSYLNHLKVFQSLLKIKMPQLLDLKQKTLGCLDQLDEAQKKVIDYQVKIQLITPKLEGQQEQQKLVLKELDYQNKEIGQKVAHLENQERELQLEREEAKRVKDDCQQKFDSVIPVLKKAIQKLQGLSKNELTELKTIKKPSESLYILMQSLCIILDIPPKRVKGKGDNAKFEDDYWSVATGNRVLNNFQIFDILSSYDPERMTPEIVQKLYKAQLSPEYTAENIKRSCVAAQGIFRWMQALQNFSMIYTECGPKRDALLLAEKAIKLKEQMILDKRTTLHENQIILRELHEKFVSKEKEIIETKNQLEIYENKNARAQRLLQQLRKEKERWSVLNNQLKKRIAALDGDCLLGSGIITYFGQLDAAKRAKYTNKWLMWLEKKNSLVKVSEDYNFIRMFGDNLQVQKMIQLGLPADTHSISSAIMLTICPLQTIVVDPEDQAKSWIKADYQSKIVSKNTEELSIITLSQMHSRFRQILRVCIKYGKTILIENIGENLDTAILSLITTEVKDSLSFEPTQVFIDGQDVEIGKGFKFYLFSELPKPNFPPDQVLLCNILNFSLTYEALESQLLSVYANKKLQKVEQDLILAKEQALFCMDNLKQMEEKVMITLRQEIETILTDNILIDQLRVIQESSKKLHLALHLIKERQKYLSDCRDKCLPAASCGAMLFTIVKQLPLLDGAYVFSLQHFMTLFQKDLENKDDSQIGNKKFMKDFQQKLIKRFHSSISMGLLQSDKILLSFLLCMQIIKNENLKYNEEQVNFILKAGRRLMNDEHFQKLGIVTQVEKDEQLYMKMQEKQKSYQNPRKVQLMNLWSDWFIDQHWDDLMLLSRIAPFDYPSIINNMIENPKAWEKYIKNAEDDFTAEIPGDYLNYNLEQNVQHGLSDKLKNDVDKAIKNVDTGRSSKLTKGGAGLYKVGILDEDDFDAIFEINDSDTEENNLQFNSEKQRPDSQAIQFKIKKLLRESLEDLENQINEEDEQIAEQKINGVHQYTEVNVKLQGEIPNQQNENSDEDDENKKQKRADEVKKRQIRLNQDLLRFCIIKIFRPELLMTQTKRFLENFLDQNYTSKLPVFNHHEVLRASTNSQVNLIIKDPNVNTHAELRHLQLLTKRQFPLHYISASYTSLQEFRQKIFEAGPNGHWILLDDLHKVAGDIPEIMKFLHQIFNFSAERENKQQIETTKQLVKKSKDLLLKKIEKETGMNSMEFQESLLYSSQDSESVQDENRSFSQSYMEKFQYLNFLKELEVIVYQQSPGPSVKTSGRSSPRKEDSIAEPTKDDTGFTFLKPPDQNSDFQISTGFRLWISIDYSFIQASKCPPSFLAASNKIMIEYEQDLKGTTSQILSSTNSELFACCQEFATQYRLGYFAMSFLHAMLVGKNQYFSLGWKVPYSFSMTDHQIASYFNLQLLKSCDADEKQSIKSITTQQYYLGEIIYGARIESLEDRNSLLSLIKQVINQQSLIRDTQDAQKIKPYNLTGLQDSQDEILNLYKMPLSLTIDFIEANLQKYPAIDRPEVFGISAQVQLLFLQKKGETLLERIYAIQCADTRIKTQIALQNQGISSHEDDLAAAEVFQIDLKRQKTKLIDALYKVPDPLEFPANLNSQNITCFALIIKKEVQLYNNLIKEISNRLEELIFCLESQSQMSIKMEAEFFQIQQDVTPNSWIAISYPAFSVLPSFLINLQDRVSYIAELLESPKLDEEHIFTFWLPGFFDPKCFLSLLRQHEAQKQKIPLDKIFFQFAVLQNDDQSSTQSISSPTQSPLIQNQIILKRHQISSKKNTQDEIFQTKILTRKNNSYLIYGLHLQCGFWDGTCIVDLAHPKANQTHQESSKLVSHFPAITIYTTKVCSLYIQNSEKTKARQFTEDDYQFSYWNEEEIVDVKQNKYYMVPVYITQDRDRLPKTKLNYGGLVTRIPLRTDNQVDKYLWAKRGLALLCHLEE